jgi:hypothetical protein
MSFSVTIYFIKFGLENEATYVNSNNKFFVLFVKLVYYLNKCFFFCVSSSEKFGKSLSLRPFILYTAYLFGMSSLDACPGETYTISPMKPIGGKSLTNITLALD